MSADIGRKLWCWTRAAETAILEAAGPTIKDKEGNINGYHGRAAAPVFKETPLQKSMERISVKHGQGSRWASHSDHCSEKAPESRQGGQRRHGEAMDRRA